MSASKVNGAESRHSASGQERSFADQRRIADIDPLRKFGIFSEPMEKLHVAKRRAQRIF
jgi:hypothetical protein